MRLNPDRAYVQRILSAGPMRMAAPSFPDNLAATAYDRENIRFALEPAAFPIQLFMQAAVCELADRTQANNRSPNLDEVLFPDAPWAPPPFPGTRGRADMPK